MISFSLDLSKAFDLMPREALWRLVRKKCRLQGYAGAVEQIQNGACYLLRVKCFGRVVTRVLVLHGVRQGSVEGPLLFVLPYADSCKKLEEARRAEELWVHNRRRHDAFPDDPEDQVTCGEVSHMDDLIITTIVKEWTEAET